MLKHVNKDNFESEVINNKEIVIADFFAVWCGPCQMLTPVLEKVAEKVDVAKIDIDESEELAIKYGIEVVPTLIFFKNGEIKKEVAGFHSEKELLEIIEKI